VACKGIVNRRAAQRIERGGGLRWLHDVRGISAVFLIYRARRAVDRAIIRADNGAERLLRGQIFLSGEHGRAVAPHPRGFPAGDRRSIGSPRCRRGNWGKLGDLDPGGGGSLAAIASHFDAIYHKARRDIRTRVTRIADIRQFTSGEQRPEFIANLRSRA